MCIVKVTGVLGFVLHLSRFTGISLIRLTRCENGYDASFSYATALYGFLSVTLANLIAITGFILEVVYNNKFPTSSILNITITITLCILFSCNAIAKTKLMLKHLGVLNKINSKLSYSIIKPRLLKQNHLALYVGCFIIYFCLTSLTFIRSVISAKNLPDYIYLALAYPSLQIFVLEILMITIKYKVYEALKNLRGELGDHLRLMIIRSHPSVVSTQTCIQNAVNAYCSICKLMNEMNEKDGKYCIFLITALLFNIVHATCDLVYRISTDKNTFDVVYDILWISLFLIRLYVIVEPCHHISEEASKIKVIFSKLMCYTTTVGKPSSWEWDLIIHQLYLLDTTFTPFGMITLDRTLLISIISVTTTYLAIAIPHTRILYNNMTFV